MLPFDGRSLAQKIEDAKTFLQEQGYLVRGPLLTKDQIRTPAKLVRYFYERMLYYNAGLNVASAASSKKDLSIAKQFVEARMQNGVDNKRAYGECCLLIDFLFRHESSVGLPFKVLSFSVLGQDTMSWVSDKLIAAYNGYNNSIRKEQEQVYHDKVYRQQEQEDLTEEQLKEINKRLGLD